VAKYESKHIVNKEILLKLGQKIRALRKQQDLTLEELSEKAGINFKYLQKCEKGRSNPSISILYSISKGLGVALKCIIDV
jgi:transcriptional regulator with XRE-family HTH domain